MRWPRALLVAVAVVFCGACSRANKETGVAALDENFVRAALSLSPSAATAQGYHEHHGVVLDELLDDFSPSGIKHARDVYQQFLSDIKRRPEHSISAEDEADLDIIRLQCESQLLDIEHIQSYRHNPTIYVETIGTAIYSPFVLNYAPEEKRLKEIVSRMEKIPAALETARKNLRDSPEIWNRVAQEENQGNIDLIDRAIRAKVPAALKKGYDVAASDALGALRRFDGFLKTDLSRHTSDWRLGPQFYAEKFRLTLDTGDSPQRALADAETALKRMRADMRQQAVTVYPKFFPGETAPADGNTLVSQVLDRIARVHANSSRYFEAAKGDLAEATEFVRSKGLLDLPNTSSLQVIPTPEFMRGIYSVGGFAPAPALEPRLGSYYWITPFTPDMSADRIESKLREYNLYGLKILTIHEAMPGHYVQAEYASEVQPKWRGALRQIFGNVPYVEGWAVYATGLMIDQGFQNTPEMRLTFGKQMLRVIANTILDVKLQTMSMTDRQALDLMIGETFQEKEEAEKKLQRAKLSSCQLPAYFVGWRGWERLRAACEKRAGAQFRLSRFHDRALREGAAPLPILSRILLQ